MRVVITSPVFVRSAFAAAAALLAVGCETAVNPIVGTDKSFSMYGALRIEPDTQLIRVYPVEDRLRPVGSESLDATLTSKNLTTDQRRTWTDTIVTEPDGQRAHAFYSPLEAEKGQRYRIEIRDAERGTALVNVDMPPETDPRKLEPEIDRRGTEPDVRIPIVFGPEVPRIRQDATAEYVVRYDDLDLRRGITGDSVTTRVELPLPVRRVQNRWHVLIPLARHYRVLNRRLAKYRIVDKAYGLFLFGITVSAPVVNEAWTVPGDTITAEIVERPGVLSNVKNGFGFVGGGYMKSVSLKPDSAALDLSGFRSEL